MPYFKDADEVYAYIGKLFEDLAAGRGAAAEVPQGQHDRPVPLPRARVRQITVSLLDGEDGRVDCGDTDLEPEVVMTMDADTAHRFWLGKVNVTVAARSRPDEGEGPRGEDPQAGAAHQADLPALPRDARGVRAPGPARGRLMAAVDPDPLARQMAGFKDFYQYLSTTRVISGRDLIGSAGFEFQKEGAARVFIVTDEVIRGTGLVERAEEGVRDGGLEVAGVFDEVPQDSSTDVVEQCAAAAKEAGADSFLARGRRLRDGHRQGGRRRLHAWRHGARAGGLPAHAARERRHGQAARDRAAGLHPHHGRHRQRGVDGRGDQGPRGEGQARDRGLPAVPAARDPRPGRHAHAAARHRGGHRYGRHDARGGELRVAPTGARTRTRARCRRCG